MARWCGHIDEYCAIPIDRKDERQTQRHCCSLCVEQVVRLALHLEPTGAQKKGEGE